MDNFKVNRKKEITKNFQKFIDKIEIGDDGTVFSPYNQYDIKGLKSTHYGLSKMLEFAFDLMNKEVIDNNKDYIEISFDDFYNYTENARRVLTDMNYVSGDRLADNDYGFIIYENPKNYSVVELNSILPISDEELQRSYIVIGIHATNDSFIAKKPLSSYISTYNNFTPREKEAFYGEEAKKALGILQNNIKVKKIK